MQSRPQLNLADLFGLLSLFSGTVCGAIGAKGFDLSFLPVALFGAVGFISAFLIVKILGRAAYAALGADNSFAAIAGYVGISCAMPIVAGAVAFLIPRMALS